MVLRLNVEFAITKSEFACPVQLYQYVYLTHARSGSRGGEMGEFSPLFF